PAFDHECRWMSDDKTQKAGERPGQAFGSCLPDPKGSADLDQGRSIVTQREGKVGDCMDWSSVAMLLAERADLPAILLDAEGRIQLIAPAAERALGWNYQSVGGPWISRHVLPQASSAAQWFFDKALSGAARTREVEVSTTKGPATAIFESCPVGYPQGRGVLLLLKSLKYKPCEPISGDYDYEVHEL